MYSFQMESDKYDACSYHPKVDAILAKGQLAVYVYTVVLFLTWQRLLLTPVTAPRNVQSCKAHGFVRLWARLFCLNTFNIF